jgi:hypothetical protein
VSEKCEVFGVIEEGEEEEEEEEEGKTCDKD